MIESSEFMAEKQRMELSHVAVFVDRIEDSAMAPALGGWLGEAREIRDQPAIKEDRPIFHNGRTRRVRVAGASAFGVSVEDVAADAPIQPAPDGAWHHVAVWAADLPGAIAALESVGYRREINGRGADGEIATFAYMVSAAGPRVEVQDASLRQAVEADTAAREAELGPGAALLRPDHVAVVVDRLEKLRDLQRGWSVALGAQWGEVAEEAVTVCTADGEGVLRTRAVRSTGAPAISIIVPDEACRSWLAPVAVEGWHHVGFRSDDLARDAAAFEAAGFTIEYADRDAGGRLRSFVMLRAPEGTRVELFQVSGT